MLYKCSYITYQLPFSCYILYTHLSFSLKKKNNRAKIMRNSRVSFHLSRSGYVSLEFLLSRIHTQGLPCLYT